MSVSLSYGQASNDKLLQTLEKEIAREVDGFSKHPQPPYFIDYRVDDIHSMNVSASLGSLTHSRESRNRLYHNSVRVGNYTADNTKPVRENEESFDFMMNGSSLPIDNSDPAIRVELWQSTQMLYRQALDKYKAIVSESNLTEKKKQSKLQSFSVEKPEKYFEEPIPENEQAFPRKVWEDRCREFSKLFLNDAEIFDGKVDLIYSQQRRYYVSSEGASVVQNFTNAYLFITASIRTSDGETVPLHESYYAPALSGLPSDEQIKRDIQSMMERLQKLKTAPLADPYTGPAILDGPVSGVFFHEIFGHRVEGHRLRSEYDGQTFKSKVGEKILPDNISVYCDPTVAKFADQYLNGIYRYDDEGVKSRRVDIVEKGTLKTFLMSRAPLEDITTSNGHGRASEGMSPVARQSNLFINSAKTKTNQELRNMLIKECKRQGKEYGYYFKSVVGGFTFTDRYTPNAFNIFPTEVYRIFVDGRPDELVRGVDLIGTPLAMFAEITAASDTRGVFTGFCGAESGYVPVSAVAPALFVRRIETQKKPKSKVESTLLPRPALNK